MSAKNRFLAKLNSAQTARVLINLMIAAFINHRNNVPCALPCASIITVERTIVFPISLVVVFPYQCI